MKKYLLFALAILAFCKINAQSKFEVNGVMYQEDLSQKDKIAVCVMPKFNNSPSGETYKSRYEGDVIIPKTIEYDLDTYEVTGIAQFAFNYSDSLTSIAIEADIKTILPSTIINCNALESIKLSDAIEEIQMSGIFITPVLKEVKFGKGLKTIADGNFMNTSLTEIQIPDSVIAIRGSFLACPKLSRIHFGKGIKELTSSFFDCPLDEIVFTQEIPLISKPDFLDWPYKPDGELVRENRKIMKMADHVIIKVPHGCKANYEKAWGPGLNIVEE